MMYLKIHRLPGGILWLTKKHWFGYMCGDWAAFKYVWNITPEISAKIAAWKQKQNL